MTKSILITEYIINLLKANEDLANYITVDDKARIYPIDAKQGTTFPFVVVQRNNIDTSYSKDGVVIDQVNFSVIVAAKKYKDSVNIAALVRGTLELFRGEVDEDVSIKLIKFSGISEDIYNEAFIQSLNFDAIL